MGSRGAHPAVRRPPAFAGVDASQPIGCHGARWNGNEDVDWRAEADRIPHEHRTTALHVERAPHTEAARFRCGCENHPRSSASRYVPTPKMPNRSTGVRMSPLDELEICVRMMDRLVSTSNTGEWKLTTFGQHVEDANVYAAALVSSRRFRALKVTKDSLFSSC